MERAVHQLADVSDKLGKGLKGEPVGDVFSDAERRLRAADAHAGATMSTSLVAVTAPMVAFAQARAGLPGAAIALTALVGALLLAYLFATRRRPSELRALLLVLVLYCVVVPVGSYNQLHLLADSRPFTPLIAQKVLLTILGIAVASRFWLGLGLVFLTAAEALTLYFVLDMGAHKDRISLTEPWPVLVYLVIGIATLVARDQRRLASLRLLRAESEASALRQRALMLFALRDQLNSPLQTLVICVARFEGQRPPQELVRTEIDRLVTLSRELAAVSEPDSGGDVPASLDAAAELSRRR
jgi:hypothetical protein